MTYTPSQQTNNIVDLRDLHFSVIEFVNQICTYYNELTNVNSDFCREMQKTVVSYGFSEEELTKINNNNGSEALISIYYDADDVSSISLPYNKGRQLSDQFRLPYYIYIRTLKISTATTFAQSNEYMRISKMFQVLSKALTNDNFVLTITPNEINYKGTVQTDLSNKPVTINSGSNSAIGTYAIQQETLNSRQYAVGRALFMFHLRQNTI